MDKPMPRGSYLLCSLLDELGVQVVFGLPGSEMIELYEALRQSPIRAILTTDERAAAFMANGYYRASGKVAALTVIGGPGFTTALTGLAEAHHDSAALLCFVVHYNRTPGKKFRLQDIDHLAMARAVVKAAYVVHEVDDLQPTVIEAYRQAVTGEPGPVVVEIVGSALGETIDSSTDRSTLENTAPAIPTQAAVNDAAGLLSKAGRVVLFAGQGAAEASDRVRRFAEAWNSPVLTTCSGRGVIPENHPLSFYFDYSWGKGGETVNRLIAQSDLVLALGCKFSHNGTGGFRLTIPRDKLIHVDASTEVLNGNYPARLAIQGDVPSFLKLLEERDGQLPDTPHGWDKKELDVLRKRLAIEKTRIAGAEPVIAAKKPVELATFFAGLREALPENACVVTDCGLHQTITRNHYEVLSPRGLIVPADFQSMAFGIPAALGARLAAPDRPVVAIVGDGGFAMTAMELATAVRENIPLTVIVFADGHYGLVRLLQFENCGEEYAVTLHNPDFAHFARAWGITHVRWDELADAAAFEPSSDSPVTLLEVPLQDSLTIRKMHVSGKIRGAARNLLGPRVTARLKKLLRR